MQSIEQALGKLNRSSFRSRFHLSEKDRQYIAEKGMDTIRSHAADFVEKKISEADPVDDGKQTPMKGHPVFKAMHATACCCRGCLNKWYKVPLHQPLTSQQQEKIVNLLMAWIAREYENSQ